MRDQFGIGRIGGGIGRIGGGDPFFSTTSTSLAEAQITLSAPRRRFVGRRFRVEGSAFVRMLFTEFIKAGGQGHTTRREYFATKHLVESNRLKVTLQIDNQTITPPLSSDGDRVRWSHTVENASSGALRIVAHLSGAVEETSSKTGAGQPQHHSETRRFEDEDTARVTVDFESPELHISEQSITIGPPWHVVVEGTAEDESGLQPVQWQLDQSDTGTVENLSGDWSRWRTLVSLPDRSQSHVITISTSDRAGNSSADSLSFAADTAPPMLAITQPQLNPVRVLWQEGGVSVPVQGIATDTESKIQAVRWRLDGGAETEAEQTGMNWSTWRLLAPIGSPGVHTVRLAATDMSGNTSEPVVLEIRAQVSSVE